MRKPQGHPIDRWKTSAVSEDAGARRRFRSRVDPLVIAFIAVVLLNPVVAVLLAQLQIGTVPLGLQVTMFGTALLLVGLVAGTYAYFETDQLVVRVAWVFGRKIPYAQITQVTRVVSWQKGAALSKRRLRISWQQLALPWASTVDVSPRAETEFMALLQRHVPATAWAIKETQ